MTAYAPGRVEVLGNHTDYNEGFVLSAAINMGTFFAASAAEGNTCRLVAGDVMEETCFDVARPEPVDARTWSNYVRGVVHGLRGFGSMEHGFHAMFLGNIPLGAGLSSSAALEMSSGLALAALYGIRIANRLELARIGQRAEHTFAGVKCGLLDQVTSLFGEDGSLVLTDFRDLSVTPVELGKSWVLLMCNPHARHALNDSAYNERRELCEAAAAALNERIGHSVTHLRDVSWEEFDRHGGTLDPLVARRAAHIVGENKRVIDGVALLREGRVEQFGQLMYASHESSRHNFENSCPELDCIVETAAELSSVAGARLSGGGFGGSAVLLVGKSDAESVAAHVGNACSAHFGRPCETSVLLPSQGACVLD